MEKNGWKTNRTDDLSNRDVVNVREWMMTMLLMMVPLLNIFLLVRWAMSDKEMLPINKVNWARGTLVAMLFVVASVAILIGIYYLITNVYNH